MQPAQDSWGASALGPNAHGTQSRSAMQAAAPGGWGRQMGPPWLPGEVFEGVGHQVHDGGVASWHTCEVSSREAILGARSGRSPKTWTNETEHFEKKSAV